MKMKSVRFPAPVADDMARAILEGSKTVTRRVVKPQHGGHLEVHDDLGGTPCLSERCGSLCRGLRPPYQPGDILYVRETWNDNINYEIYPWETEKYIYKADWGNFEQLVPEWFYGWHPSTNMPKEAARLFLRVTEVRVERLQDMTGHDVLAEGVDNGRSNPTMGERWENMQRMVFSDLWNSTIKKADLPLYGWAANPWVWVIAFERISREEAQKYV